MSRAINDYCSIIFPESLSCGLVIILVYCKAQGEYGKVLRSILAITDLTLPEFTPLDTQAICGICRWPSTSQDGFDDPWT
jgi:hypothetical protein